MQKKKSRFTLEQQISHNVMVQDISKISSFPTIPTPTWVLELGLVLKDMFNNGHLTRMGLGVDGNVIVQ